MNRCCELKLEDILRVNSSKRKKNPNESDIICKEVLIKKLKENYKEKNNSGNIVVSSKNDDTFRDVEKSAEQRITRSSNRKQITNLGYKKSSKEQLFENKVSGRTSSLKYLKNHKNIEPKRLTSKIMIKTEERQPAVELSRGNLINKKGCLVKDTIDLPDSLNKTDNCNKKMRKRKTHNSFWESKLTGARRVSKRLTNLKNKNKILRKLETGLDTHHKLYEKKNPIALKVEYKSKAVQHVKLGKKEVTNLEKPGHSRNLNEQKSSYDKLSQTNKLYPRVAPNRKKSSSLRGKIKSTILPKLSDIKVSLNVFNDDSGSKNQESCSAKEVNTNSNVCLTNIIGEPLLKENNKLSADSSNRKDMDGNPSNNDTNVPKVSDAVAENTVELAQKSDQNDCISEMKDESVNSSEVIEIDLESGENVLLVECEILAENLNSSEFSDEIKGQELEQVLNSTPSYEVIPHNNSAQKSELVDDSGTGNISETDTIVDSVEEITIVQVERMVVNEDKASSGDQKNNIDAINDKSSSLNEAVGK